MSILLNTLLLYPDHPYDFDEIWARAFDPQTKEYVKFLVTEPENLTREALYAKERALIADVKEELRQGRRCQVYATYTGEKDVTLRLETVLRQEGIRVAVLRSSVATDKREDWYDRQLKAGVEVVICHPKLVETGLDLLAFPTLYFYETGYSLHTLRQASRRSWRIGQRFPVRVKFVTYSGTMQETCLRLMGKKMLVALMMEGKFSGEGLQALDTDEDLMSAMARELVEKAGVGESADAVWRELDHEREKVLPRPCCCGTRTRRGARSGPRSVIGIFRSGRRAGSDAIRHPPDRTESAFKEAEEDRDLADRHRNQRAAQSLRLSRHAFNLRGDIMNEERDKVRCRSCELVQWSDRANCRRCGTALPEPIVRIVERVVEKIVIRQDPQCLQKLEQASRLISTATERLTQQCVESVAPFALAQVPETGVFPTMAEVERAMIVAAYERSNRRPLEAARLLGIGKTTVYRKLREIGEAAA